MKTWVFPAVGQALGVGNETCTPPLTVEPLRAKQQQQQKKETYFPSQQQLHAQQQPSTETNC